MNQTGPFVPDLERDQRRGLQDQREVFVPGDDCFCRIGARFSYPGAILFWSVGFCRAGEKNCCAGPWPRTPSSVLRKNKGGYAELFRRF